MRNDTKIKKICPQCGESFLVSPSRAKQQYCSYACRGKSQVGIHKVGRIDFNCKYCGKKFSLLPGVARNRKTIKYCSQECMGKATRDENAYINLPCAYCGKIISKLKCHLANKSYCSRDCSMADKQKPDAKWRNRNYIKAYMRNYSHVRRSRMKNLETTLTESEWENILASYSYACAYCGRAWWEINGKLHQEHVIPVVQGGGYTKDNIVPACDKCNKKKAGRTPQQAGMKLLERRL